MTENVQIKKLDEFNFVQRFFLRRSLSKIHNQTLECQYKAMVSMATKDRIRAIQNKQEEFMEDQHELNQTPQSEYHRNAYTGVVLGVAGVIIIDLFAGHAGIKKATIHLPIAELPATAMIVIGVLCLEFLIGKGITHYSKLARQEFLKANNSMNNAVLLPTIITACLCLAGIGVAIGFPMISLAEYTDTIATYDLMLERGKFNSATYDNKVSALRYLYMPLALFSAIGHLCIVFLHTVIIAAFSFFNVRSRVKTELNRVEELMEVFRKQYVLACNAFMKRDLMFQHHVARWGIHEALPLKNPFPEQLQAFYTSAIRD